MTVAENNFALQVLQVVIRRLLDVTSLYRQAVEIVTSSIRMPPIT